MIRICFFLIILLIATYAQASSFKLYSPDLICRGFIKQEYTCQGDNAPPTLIWKNPPARTKTYAVIVEDPNVKCGHWYLWVMYNIPEYYGGILSEKGQPPEGVTVLPNSWGKAKYSGPCPKPEKIHRYRFTVYAVDKVLNVSNIQELKAQLARHTLASSAFVAPYQLQQEAS